jgi:hypothetical protein
MFVCGCLVDRLPSTVTAPADPTLHYTGNRTVQDYINKSNMFTELRLCPCYNMIPRAIMEHMNCLPTPGATQTLSSTYLVCQAVDMDAIYSGPRYFPTGGLPMVRVPCFYRALACRRAPPCSALIT